MASFVRAAKVTAQACALPASLVAWELWAAVHERRKEKPLPYREGSFE